MIIIPLSDEFAPEIQSGKKRTTIRRGVRPYPGGDCILRTSSEDLCVTIQGVRYSALKDLTEHDARRDGFATVEELQQALLRFYPDLGPGEPLTVVEFARRGNAHD